MPVTGLFGGSLMTGMALQPDGKIVVTGWSVLGNQIVARYKADGALDRTFGDNGIVITHIGQREWTTGESVAIQADGRIIVAGDSWDPNVDTDLALARYL